MKWQYLITAALPLLLSASENLRASNPDPTRLSGNVSLTLKHGIWKLWQEKPIYQDMNLALTCEGSNFSEESHCEPEIWGYAPKFNQDVDHQGTVTLSQRDGAWQLQVKLQVQSHPWNPETAEATYDIEILPEGDGLTGSFAGNFKGRTLEGSVRGETAPRWPLPVPRHQPLSPQEYPRLIFRRSQLPELRAKAKTRAGKEMLARLQQTLQAPVYYEGYVPTGGYHAAGYCLLWLLQDDVKAAAAAGKLVENSMARPGKRLLEQSPIVAGVALAYDLCYGAWTPERRQRVSRWLLGQANWLLKGDSPKNGWNNNPWSNWNGRARAAAGLAALALIDDPQFPQARRFSQLAERHIRRYLKTAIGNSGFGIEGDHYTTEVFTLTVFPFLQAYRNATGLDLVEGSGAELLLPLYLMRTVPQGGELPIPAYGRHRYYAGGSLFAMGLGTLPVRLSPPVMAFFARYLGQAGDRSFGIASPYQAAYALAAYQEVPPENPLTVFDRVLVDEAKGFYLFRNRWQDDNDFVASIYLKRQPLGGSWSFPDVGSFRIWGLGGHWANPGPSEAEQQENTVFLPQTRPWNAGKPISFESRPDGSGTVSLRTDDIFRPNSDPPVGIGSVRSFAADYSGAAGVPGLFAVADRFLGSTEAEEFREKVWVMHTEGEVTLQGQRFTIRAANGATMAGTFVAPAPVKLSWQKTATGGKILAAGGSEFFVVMSVQQGSAPAVQVSGSGLNATVKVGEQEIRFEGDRLVLSKF